jgi:16S rRNA processing protein RimM
MAIQFLAVGRVVRPHGVRGELVLEVMTEFPLHLAEVETVYVGEAAVPHPLRRVRQQRGQQIVIQLADCLDRNAAETYRGQLVQIKTEQAAPLPPGRYYHHQILGLAVVTEAGEALGQVTEILETGANDVYVVTGAAGEELLLPALRSVILLIDLEARRMTVHVPEGLRPPPGAQENDE